MLTLAAVDSLQEGKNLPERHFGQWMLEFEPLVTFLNFRFGQFAPFFLFVELLGYLTREAKFVYLLHESLHTSSLLDLGRFCFLLT